MTETYEHKVAGQLAWWRALEDTPESIACGIALEVTHVAEMARQDQGISRSELARRMGVSPSYVSRLLRGEENSTLLSLVKLAEALGLELRAEMTPKAKKRAKLKVEKTASASAKKRKTA